MILATQRLKNGRPIYVDAFSGREIRLNRMIGHGMQKLPDYAFRYLIPQPKSNSKGIKREFPNPIDQMRNRNQERAIDPKAEVNLKVKFWWFRKMVNWIKNRFK